MAVNSVQDYYINPKALSFTPNYQGYKNIVYVSIVSNAAIKVFLSHVSGLGYGVDAQPQTWRLSGTTTALGTASAYFIYARLSRTKQTADIIFSVRDYTVEGGYSYTDSEGNAQTVEKSDEYFYIKIGSLTETDIVGDKATVNRVLTYASGELDTFKQRNEKSDSVFEQMFEFVSSTVGEVINVKKPFHSIKVAFESVFNGLATFVKGFVLGEKEITAIATSEDDYNEEKRDSTLPTTGYVQKELEALDDHFLIKDDADTEQSVAGTVTFEKEVTIQGDHAVEGVQTIGKEDAAGNIDVNKVVQEVKGKQILHGGFQTPNFFQQGDFIQGAQVDADGNAAFTSITAPVMQIYELQYNRKTAVQEEFIFSDGDTIETVTYIQADGTEIDSTVYDGEEYSYIRLGVRKQYEGYMTTFKDEDILYSNVNIIGESGQPATTGKCWMRVLALDNDLGVDPISSDGLFINAILYSEAQCPGNVNIPPTPHMIVSRHGNTNGTKHPDRQSVFIVSTSGQNMVQLRGISSPIIPSEGAYGVVIGKLPQTLVDYVRQYAEYVNENEPYVYARGIIVQDFIQLDYLGRPVKTENYRGQWSLAIAKGEVEGEPRYMNTVSTYDTVTHRGVLWGCQQSGTTVEPNDSTTEWTMKAGKGDDIYAPQYKLNPSVNVIYLRRDSGLSVNSIDVTVGESSAYGYMEISDQSVLDSKNLKVQWSIDGVGDRNDLSISQEGLFELEDGSGYLLEEDGEALYLEGELIDVSAIKDNITLYLVDTSTGSDIFVYVIPVIKDGENGETMFKSIVFVRSNKEPEKPSNEEQEDSDGVYWNTFSNPIPLGWFDGIPEGSEKVWMTTRMFTSATNRQHDYAWSDPQDISDTADMETMFTARNPYENLTLILDDISFSKDGVVINADWLEKANGIGWYDEANQCVDESGNLADAIYMAVTTASNGVWREWQIMRVKGERGDDGTSIKVKGSYEDEESFKNEWMSEDGNWKDPSDVEGYDADSAFIVGVDLWVWDGSAWSNAGPFKGQDGADGADGADGKDGTSNYLHIKYATSLVENTWTDEEGETPGPYIGIYVDENVKDSSDWDDYTWSRWQGYDGSFKSIVFKRSSVVLTDAPKGGSYSDPIPDGWSDGIPSGTDPVYSSSCTFYADGNSSGWTSPTMLADSSHFDVIYSTIESPSAPENHPNTNTDWVEESTKQAIWMATSRKAAGSDGWSGWVVARIKGEQGPQGDSAISLDLDNEMDSMLYGMDGNPISSSVSSTATLFEGGKPVTNGVEITYKAVGCTVGYFGNGTATVTALSENSAQVIFKATYKEVEYSKTFSIKKIVGTDKYSIHSDKDVVTYNSSEGFVSQSLSISVYRTYQNAEGTVANELVSTLPDGFTLSSTGSEIGEYSDGVAILNTVIGKDEYVISLNDSSGTLLDSETIPVLNIKNGDNGADGKDGKDGQDGISFDLKFDPIFIEHPIDPETKATIGGAVYSAVGTMYRNGVEMSINGFGITASVDNANGGTAFANIANGKVSLLITIQAYVSSRATKATVTITRPSAVPASYVPWNTYTASLPIVYAQRGIVGPMGNDGASYYPQGYWDPNTTYEVTTDKNGVVIARPIVYYDADNNGNGTYYVLIADSSTGHDPRYYSDKWRPFASLGYVFTEALMAQWSRLAKAVFYGDYMFSAWGVDSNGAFSEYTKDMFANGRLNGNFVPSLFLDLLNGGAKFGKLSESYLRIRNRDDNENVILTPLFRINADECHNVAREFIAGSKQLDGIYPSEIVPTVVVLPSSSSNDEFAWTEDGTHCTIIHEFSMEYTQAPNADQYRNSVVVICSDYRFFQPLNSGYSNVIQNMTYDEDGWMIWEGRRCKFAFLSAGAMIKLRSIRSSSGNIVWMIENGQDFEKMSGKINVYRDYYDDSDTIEAEIYNDTESMAGGAWGHIICSPPLNDYRVKDGFAYPTEWILDSSGVNSTEIYASCIRHKDW